MTGWVLVVPRRLSPGRLARLVTSSPRRVCSITSDPRAAVRLLAAELVDGIVAPDVGVTFTGLIESFDRDRPPAPAEPGRPVRLSRPPPAV